MISSPFSIRCTDVDVDSGNTLSDKKDADQRKDARAPCDSGITRHCK